MKTTENDNLKKCIVCGHEGQTKFIRDNYGMYSIICSNCGAHTRRNDKSGEVLGEWKRKDMFKGLYLRSFVPTTVPKEYVDD